MAATAMRRWEGRLLAALGDCAREPRVAGAARALSWSGEHAAVWLLAGGAAALADRDRRAGWLRGTGQVAAAHLAGMGLKRVVRRPRPGLPGRPPLVHTAGRYSFPSAHAASAGAAAVALARVRPGAPATALPALAALVCVSRLVAGVHYPSDVLAGAALGALTAHLGNRLLPAGTADAGAAAVGTVGVGAADVGSAGVGAAGVGVAAAGTAGARTADAGSADVGTAGVGTPDVGTADAVTAAVGASGAGAADATATADATVTADGAASVPARAPAAFRPAVSRPGGLHPVASRPASSGPLPSGPAVGDAAAVDGRWR
ncbi:phosphatase PAP2 family protein [Streptomyces cacaoi]|uniref:phosphatase PAP2 family protein n=1 Tax=Streptomyces cacaoi TaxID=1898 RepID=UPI003748DEA1